MYTFSILSHYVTHKKSYSLILITHHVMKIKLSINHKIFIGNVKYHANEKSVRTTAQISLHYRKMHQCMPHRYPL